MIVEPAILSVYHCERGYGVQLAGEWRRVDGSRIQAGWWLVSHNGQVFTVSPEVFREDWRVVTVLTRLTGVVE